MQKITIRNNKKNKMSKKKFHIYSPLKFDKNGPIFSSVLFLPLSPGTVRKCPEGRLFSLLWILPWKIISEIIENDNEKKLMISIH